MRVERIGDATLYLGDCLEVLSTLGPVDAVVTDPPYGVGFDGKNTKHTARRGEGYESGDDADIGPTGTAAALGLASRGLVFPGARLLFRYPEPREVGAVSCPSGAGNGRWGWICSHPILYYGKNPQPQATPNGFTSFDVSPPNGHPCPKPDRWMRWAVKKASLPGETVLDPFMGSGTTGVACANLGRKFIGVEIEPKYFDIACRRIEDAQRQGKLFEPEPQPEQVSLLEVPA